MQPIAATRQHALERLEAFRPRMGRRYAAERNTDHGPGRHFAVSRLSPFLRRRLITEPEAIAAAVRTHGAEAADKFVQEVLWRGYLKGWLERRPTVWDSYRAGLAADLARVDRDRDLAARLERAESGGTGLDGFDDWASELVETGYLHNHARMWFASIWIFTLGLPWRLGADFFYRHLLDGDPASNTLGWRWVAGLHTRGKAYEATAANIARFTEGRVTLRDADLAAAVPLDDEEPEGLPPYQPVRAVAVPARGVPSALMITEEDCRIEEFDLAALDIRAAARLPASALRSGRATADAVHGFEAEALADAASRAGLEAERLSGAAPDVLLEWAGRVGARQIVTGYVPTGPLRDALALAEPVLRREGVALCEWRRDWDLAVWRHATAGYFKVKTQTPALLRAFDLL